MSKPWDEMEYNEFTEAATAYAHTRLLEDGGKGLHQAIRDIVWSAMQRGKERAIKELKEKKTR